MTWDKSDPASRRRRIEPYLGRLFGYAFALAQDREAARDLVQECALKALEARRTPADEAAYRAWLFRILRNAFIDGRRRARLEAEQAQVVETGWDVWQSASRLISELAVRQAMARLTGPHREIVGLVDVAGFTYAESAALLELPVGTVMSRLARARRSLLELVQASNLETLPVKQRKDVGR